MNRADTHTYATPFAVIGHKGFVHAGHGFGILLTQGSSIVVCDKLVGMASAFGSMP